MNRLFLLCCIIIAACKYAEQPRAEPVNDRVRKNQTIGITNDTGATIESRFPLPQGYSRTPADPGSFSDYLRHLPLKAAGAEVILYDGRTKQNKVWAAVINMDIGKQNLQQCADAVIRLKAEYLFANKAYSKINFHLTNGFPVEYSRWIKGDRVQVMGNKTTWVHSVAASNTYADFRQYLDFVFTYAGSLSLSGEMNPLNYAGIAIGDVLIRGGSPGHAVIVVDMAENSVDGKKVYMLAQSYMPAQEIHILKNPGDPILSPWYLLDPESEIIETPEWVFHTNEWKRFK